MKFPLLLSALFLVSTSLAQASDLDSAWQSALYRACMGNTLSAGTVCFEKDYTGQTNLQGPFGYNNLVTVKVHVKVRKPDYTSEILRYDPEFTITQVSDTNNLFQPLSNLPITAVAIMPNSGRGDPNVKEFRYPNSVTINRSYGSTVFWNSNTFTVKLSSNFGAESTGAISKLELYFPGQSNALVVPF